MPLTYKFFLYFHILVGFLSLVFFWIPVIAKKGGAWHRRSGHWYVYVMNGVGISALILSSMLIIDPIGFKYAATELSAEQIVSVTAKQRDIGLFLMAIAILTLVGVRHGLQTIQAKGNHAIMRDSKNLGSNILLLLIGLALGWNATGGSGMSVLFYIFAGLCTYVAISNLLYCFKAKVTRGEQIIAHLSSIIGAGIGSHTAFFVFGANRMLADLLSGYLMMIPWVLPGVVGTLLITLQARKYKPVKKAAPNSKAS